MGIKQITTSVALSLLMFTAVQAQEIKTDSIGGSPQKRNEQTDSLKVLTSELAQIKSKLDNVEKESYYEKVWKRKKYWKFGFSNPSIERTDGNAMTWETEFAFTLQRGKTLYFHSKPLWGMVKFGLDYGFMDLGYAKLKLKTAESTGNIPSTPGSNPNGGFDDIISDDPSGSVISALGVDLGMHKIDYSLHVGPSISVNPWNHLIVAAYFHVMPTASGILENDTFSYGFGCATSAGVSISYKVISVGVEGIWNTIKYKQASFDDEEDDGKDDVNLFNTKDFKLKQNGPRFYIALRF